MTERWLLIGTDARVKELAKKMSRQIEQFSLKIHRAGMPG